MNLAAGRSLALGILVATGAVLGSWACGSATGLEEEGEGVDQRPDGESPDGQPPEDQVAPDQFGPDGCGGCIDVISIDGFDGDDGFDGSDGADVEPFDGFDGSDGFDEPDVEPFDVFPIEGGGPDIIFPFDGIPPPFDGPPPFDTGPQDTGPPWDGGTPVAIATLEQPANLALDDTYVYWENNGGSAVDCPLAGCPSNTPTILSIGDVGFGSYQTLATGVGLAYFIDVNGNIVDCSGGACGNSPTTYTGTSDEDSGFFDGIEQLITDGSNVYWTDSVSVYQCPLGATCGSPLELITSSNADIGPLAVSSTEVYYADAGEFTQSIRAVAIGGGPARHVCVSGLLQDVATMVWTPEYVYFTTGEDPTAIYQCASGGGSSPTVYFSDSSPYGLAADGTNLYWTNDVDPGNVATCALGATCGASRTIASNQNDPLAIAVNATSVYWTTANAVYRATKP